MRSRRSVACCADLRSVGRVKIIFTRDTDDGKERIAAGAGQRHAHPLRYSHIAERADWPVRRDPFAGGVGKDGRKPDHTGLLIDNRRLHNGQFVFAKGLSNNLEAA
jgi:hypothetical protein